jgi:hypothetical protein
MAKAAMFVGLVFDEEGRPADTADVGDRACYVIMDDDFRRHIDAEEVDRQVLRYIRGQVEEHREIALETMMELMGKNDLFTKVALESSINRMEETVGNPMPEEARQYMGMLGFRIVIDFHGNVVDIEMPAGGVGEDE